MAWQHGRKCKRTDIRSTPRDRSTPPNRMPYSWVVTRSWRTIIAGLLAFWMPLCCCQIAAIAGTGAPCCAAPVAASTPAPAESCCAPKPIRSCCENPAADSACDAGAPVASGCGLQQRGAQSCDDSDRGHGTPAADTCTCCATKAPVPEQDPVDPILSAHAAADAIPASMVASCASAAPVLACNGPPDDGCAAPWANGPWPCAHATERCAQLSCWTE